MISSEDLFWAAKAAASRWQSGELDYQIKLLCHSLYQCYGSFLHQVLLQFIKLVLHTFFKSPAPFPNQNTRPPARYKCNIKTVTLLFSLKGLVSIHLCNINADLCTVIQRMVHPSISPFFSILQIGCLPFKQNYFYVY